MSYEIEEDPEGDGSYLVLMDNKGNETVTAFLTWDDMKYIQVVLSHLLQNREVE